MPETDRSAPGLWSSCVRCYIPRLSLLNVVSTVCRTSSCLQLHSPWCVVGFACIVDAKGGQDTRSFISTVLPPVSVVIIIIISDSSCMNCCHNHGCQAAEWLSLHQVCVLIAECCGCGCGCGGVGGGGGVMLLRLVRQVVGYF